MSIDRIWDFLQRLSPLTRSCLLAELERLEVSGVDMPGSADIQAKLALIRSAQARSSNCWRSRSLSGLPEASQGISLSSPTISQRVGAL